MKNKLKVLARLNGYQLTDNVDKIIKAKERFFSADEWSRCPCDPNSDRACISDRCKSEIETGGMCHCRLFKRGE